MTRPPSLTRRLIATLTLGAAVVWLAAAAIATTTLKVQLDAAFDGGLRETAERLLPLAIDGLDDGDHDGPHEAPYFDGDTVPEVIVYQLRDASGRLLMRSHNAPSEPFAAPLAEGYVETAGLRLYTLGTPDARAFIQVGEMLARRAQSLLGSLAALLVPLLLLVPLSAAGIWLAVRAGLRPLAALRDEVAQRGAGNLTPIATQNLPVEIAPIADAIQGLIERVSAALDAERAFAANSAHELRTPVAGSLAQTQRLVAELDGHPAEGRARQIEDSLKRLRTLSEKLLQLSRADAGMARADAPRDLLPALRLIVGDAQRSAGGNRLTLELRGRLAAAIDIDAFGIAMRNLIDNALLHGDAAEPVLVRVPTDGVIEVLNGGPVIPADQLAGLIQRFQRGGTLAPGSGLGLSIVETIVRQVGGTLTLQSPPEGHASGFAARIDLP